MSMTRRERRRSEGDERRAHRRVPVSLLRSLTAHLSGGSDVKLLDLSQAGVRLETTRHMRPGQMVSLRFAIDDQQVTINAAVVRSAVVRLEAEQVRYETGLRLVDEFSSEQLQLALVERRGATGGAIPDDVVCPEPFVFTGINGPSGEPKTGGGWWLAGKRPVKRRILQGC
jgi:hypothetical protein